MLENNGYIAFMRPKTLQDKLVARLDGGLFCHCELMVRQNADGTWQTISSLPATGVRIRNVTLGSKDWVKQPVEVDVYYCLEWYKAYAGQAYDYAGLATTKLPFISGQKNKWFCSEAIADMLKLKNPATYGIQDLYNWVKNHV